MYKSFVEYDNFYKNILNKMMTKGEDKYSFLKVASSTALWDKLWNNAFTSWHLDRHSCEMLPADTSSRKACCNAGWEGFYLTETEFEWLKRTVMGRFTSFGEWAD